MMSRSGTVGSTFELTLPTSTFAAQVLGQILGKENIDPGNVALAYARDKNGAHASQRVLYVRA
jgi:hypothetical protein